MDQHIDRVMAARRRSRRLGLLIQLPVAALVLWSLQAIVIGDTVRSTE